MFYSFNSNSKYKNLSETVEGLVAQYKQIKDSISQDKRTYSSDEPRIIEIGNKILNITSEIEKTMGSLDSKSPEIHKYEILLSTSHEIILHVTV
jgi:septation ring formation regulator EzrA